MNGNILGHEEIIMRIAVDYIEMPDLKVTARQARRLWNVPAEACDRALAALVERGFLVQRASDPLHLSHLISQSNRRRLLASGSGLSGDVGFSQGPEPGRGEPCATVATCPRSAARRSSPSTSSM